MDLAQDRVQWRAFDISGVEPTGSAARASDVHNGTQYCMSQWPQVSLWNINRPKYKYYSELGI
jgi:hypothetical protein